MLYSDNTNKEGSMVEKFDRLIFDFTIVSEIICVFMESKEK